MKCPMCGCADATVYAEWPDFKVHACDDCGFRYIDMSAPGYPADAQYVYEESELGEIRPELPHIQRRLHDVLRFKQPPGHVLEIGCGKGETALALHQAGFEVTGIDMKPRIMTQLKQAHPEIEWRCTTTDELSKLSEKYDVVIMFHVFEHVSDPRALLSKIKSLAKPGALIVIEVPNVGGWKAKIEGPRWGYYKIDHVNYFRPKDLHYLANDLGLSVLATRGYQHFSYPQDELWKDLIKGMLGGLGFKNVVSVFLREE